MKGGKVAMKRYVLPVVLCLLSLMGACTKEVTRDRVIGEYEANHDLAKDTLEVRADGTYIHHYQIEGSKEFIYMGKWELEEWEGEPLVTFEGWYSPEPLGSEPEIMGKKVGRGRRLRNYWSVRVEWSVFGKQRFCINRDLGYFYVKKEEAKGAGRDK